MSYLVRPGLAVLILFGFGCSAKSPVQKLAGKWLGTVHVKEAVDQAIDSAVQGKEINPLARGAARFFGQKLAEATMSVELDFHSDGRVFFRGNTDVLDLPPDSDGTWEASSAGTDLLEIRFGTESKQLRGQILFRDKDEFTLKLDSPPSATQAKEGTRTVKESSGSILFRRNKG